MESTDVVERVRIRISEIIGKGSTDGIAKTLQTEGLLADPDQIVKLRGLLMEFVDCTPMRRDPCNLDHHGYCQEHVGGFAEGGCATRRVREFLAKTEINNKGDEQ